MTGDDRRDDLSRTIIPQSDGRWIALSKEFNIQLIADSQFQALNKLRLLEDCLREWDQENEYLKHKIDQEQALYAQDIEKWTGHRDN